MKITGLILCLFLSFSTLFAFDGYKLWLQYYPVEKPTAIYKTALSHLDLLGNSPTLDIIRKEIKTAFEGFYSEPFPGAITSKSHLTIGLPNIHPSIKKITNMEELAPLGEEGYLIKTYSEGGTEKLLITANSEIGLLYGTFKLLQLIQKGEEIPKSGFSNSPKIKHRVLNHWDNLNRSVERGYAGSSIWNWHRLPRHIDQQYHDYARANASIGINGTSVTNVNANALVLTPIYLEKAKALADVFRPYGIKLYLTARFSSPWKSEVCPQQIPWTRQFKLGGKKKPKRSTAISLISEDFL